jgi:predicted KAP-like P-loop ATPase
MEILTDPPITSKREDKLMRAPLAEKVAGMLFEYNKQESFVIGIEGEWGSGKTSFMGMILETLVSSKGRTKIDVIKLNPWNFSNTNASYIELFTLLGELVGDKNKTLKYVKQFSQKVNDVEIAPEFLGISLGKIGIHLDHSLEKLREDIEKKLNKYERKILVVVDDIDRLDKEDTREIFKLIKITANFPNIIYLVAYDRDKVENILTENGFPGDEYLKKIVQISFSLPKPSPSELYNILGKELDATLESKAVNKIVKKYWNDTRWGNLFVGGFRDVFKTIRDIKRFVSSWRLDYLIVGYGNVNPMDFLGIELIRVFAPLVYSKMSENKSLFTETDGDYISSSSSQKAQKNKALYEEIISTAPSNIKTAVDGVCKELFPQIESQNSHDSSWRKEWEKELRVCSGGMFDIYFSLAVPEGNISQTEFEDIIQNISNPRVFEKRLKEIENQLKLRAVLDKILFNLESFETKQKEKLLQALFNFGDDLHDERGMWDFDDSDTKIGRICYQSLKQIEDENERIRILKNSFIKSHSLYTSSRFVGILIDEMENKEKNQNKEQLISNIVELGKFKKLIVNKIKNGLIKSNHSVKNKHLAALVIWWNKLSTNSKEAKKYASGFLKTKTKLVLLLTAFKLTSFSIGGGDYVSTKKERIDTKSLDNLLGLKNIDNAIAKYIKGASKTFKELVELYEKSKKSSDFD